MRDDSKHALRAAAGPGWVRRAICGGLAALTAQLALGGAAAAQTWEQKFDLMPGWNAIYLHVQPAFDDPEIVFGATQCDGNPNGAVPVRSVWTRAVEPSGAAQYIQNPAEALEKQPGWLAYVPPDQPDKARAMELARISLQSVRGNRAFLIDLGGTCNGGGNNGKTCGDTADCPGGACASAPVTLCITGRPLPPLLTWEANAYNLVGLPVDPGNAPTFAGYFAPSPAHRGQPAYRLSPGGTWEPVALNAETIKYGEAYWVYSTAGSRYVAPVGVQMPTSDGLNYGRAVAEHTLRFTNATSSPATVVVEQMSASPDTVPLSYLEVNTAPGPNLGAFEWLPLATSKTVDVPANGIGGLQLGVRRAEFGDKVSMASVVAVAGGGARLLIPLQATTVATAPVSGAMAAQLTRQRQADSPMAGLWLGAVTVKSVSQPNDAADPLTPVATGGLGNRCAGGANDGASCQNDAACPGLCAPAPTTCSGGINNGLPCRPSARCRLELPVPVCEGGGDRQQICAQNSDCPPSELSPDCPGAQCTVGGVCKEGARVGSACSKSCSSGPQKGKACAANADCGDNNQCRYSSVCPGGLKVGEPCWRDSDCPVTACPIAPSSGSLCRDGARNGMSCTDDADCPTPGRCLPGSFCQGGSRAGEPCWSTGECAGGMPVSLTCPLAQSSCGDSSGDRCVIGAAAAKRCLGGAKHNQVCAANDECTATCEGSGAGSEFPLRILIHVDSKGQARLLKQVMQLWKEGTTGTDSDGMTIDKTGGHYVLVTNEAAPVVKTLSGSVLVDGVKVGRRMSTPFYDFPDRQNAADPLNKTLDMTPSGAFGTGKLSARLMVSPTLPGNPFRHPFHPDHDDLDDKGMPVKTPGTEVFAVTRDITLDFKAPGDTCKSSTPDDGFDTFSGAYQETLTGLHSKPIAVAGCFELKRVAMIGELNQ